MQCCLIFVKSVCRKCIINHPVNIHFAWFRQSHISKRHSHGVYVSLQFKVPLQWDTPAALLLTSYMDSIKSQHWCIISIVKCKMKLLIHPKLQWCKNRYQSVEFSTLLLLYNATLLSLYSACLISMASWNTHKATTCGVGIHSSRFHKKTGVRSYPVLA